MKTLMELPYGVGRITRGWLAIIGGSALVAVAGGYAYSRQFAEGFIVTGLRDWGTMGGTPWGLYIAFDVYFVGVSFAGITIAALIRLANLEKLRPISRLAEVLTIVSLVLAGLSVIADLGQPVRGMLNLFRYARPQSPMFGTFTLVVAGYLLASVVFMYLDGRRDAAILRDEEGKRPLRWLHRLWAAGYHDTPAERERHSRASFLLALSIIPLLVAAHSTLGFVFGLQVGRPGWFSALQAPAFVILAGVSGIGLLIVVTAVLRRWLHLSDQIDEGVFRWLGMFMMILIFAYLYFMSVELLTSTYAAPLNERLVTRELLRGRYAWMYWSAVGLLVGSAGLVASQAVRRRWSIGALAAAGVAVNVAAIFKRFLIVVPSLTHGSRMPYGPGSYTPTWVEYGVVVGIVALGVLLFALFVHVFPIVPLKDREEGAGA